jgi:hypothetical protein
LDIGGDAEPPGASRGDDEVRHVEWSSMVVQIGARRRVEGRLELAMTAEIVRAILTTRCTTCCGVWWRHERRGRVFIEGLGSWKGLGFSGGDTDRTAAEEAVTGPVSDARKKLTGGSHLSVAGQRRARTLSGAGDLLGWASFLA